MDKFAAFLDVTQVPWTISLDFSVMEFLKVRLEIKNCYSAVNLLRIDKSLMFSAYEVHSM